MRILVTGATGRIGRSLVQALKTNHYFVRAIARSFQSDLRYADDYHLTSLSPHSDFTCLLEDIDVVIHLADGFNAYENHPLSYQDKEAELRLQTLQKLAEMAGQARIKMIYLSTIKTMCGPSVPEILRETTASNPQSLYGRLKCDGEKAILESARKHNSAAVILRFPIVFGAHIGGNMEKLLALSDTSIPLPFKGLKSRRSLISCDSLIDAILSILQHHEIEQSLYLLHDGALPLETIIHLFHQGLERKPHLLSLPMWGWTIAEQLPFLRDKIQRFTGSLVLDDTLFRRHFHWRPKQSLEDQLIAFAKTYHKLEMGG